MDQVISNLKAKEIIYKKSIEVLKKYIIDKYPEASDAYRAQVFADAIHKIIDDHIREFRRSDQRVIKAKLLKTTANKKNFEIFAYDIMRTCVSLDIDEESFVDDMTSWINRQQDIPVYRHQLIEITDVVKEEMAAEARAEAAEENRASAATQSQLLAQLEEAFGYQPYYENEEDIPELYTQGEVNTAYEAEIRKDIQEGAQGLKEASAPAPEIVESKQVIIERPQEEPVIVEEETFFVPSSTSQGTSFDMFSVMDQLYEDQPFTEDDQETTEDSDNDSLEALAEEERPIIKVTMDPEPYFTEWPEEQANEDKRHKFMDEIRGALAGKDVAKLIGLVILSVAGFIAVIWLLVQVIGGNFAKEATMVLPETTTIEVTTRPSEVESTEVLEVKDTLDMAMSPKGIDNTHLHESIQYKPIDQTALQAFFQRNDNLIGEEPYFSTVVEVAEDYGVNPLLLFAITGQEQHFVPKDHEFAALMINNPFNVYGSWETYNTDIEESTQIAARTILTASEGRTEGTDPVEWINQTYAEDENWSTGVNLIFEHLEAIAGR